MLTSEQVLSSGSYFSTLGLVGDEREQHLGGWESIALKCSVLLFLFLSIHENTFDWLNNFIETGGSFAITEDMHGLKAETLCFKSLIRLWWTVFSLLLGC